MSIPNPRKLLSEISLVVGILGTAIGEVINILDQEGWEPEQRQWWYTFIPAVVGILVRGRQ